MVDLAFAVWAVLIPLVGTQLANLQKWVSLAAWVYCTIRF
jgi:hypothetical protein